MAFKYRPGDVVHFYEHGSYYSELDIIILSHSLRSKGDHYDCYEVIQINRNTHSYITNTYVANIFDPITRLERVLSPLEKVLFLPTELV